jgi:ABC-type multidrug transport system fused ATPase/permease subunit
MKEKTIFLCLLGFMMIPLFASAAGGELANPATNFFFSLPDNSFKGILLFVIKQVLSVAGLIAVAFVIWGGYQYVMSGGNDEMAEKGKKTLINAIIGVAIIVLSWMIIGAISKLILGS